MVSERKGKVATNMFRSRIVRAGDRDVGTPISDNLFAGRIIRDVGRSAVSFGFREDVDGIRLELLT